MPRSSLFNPFAQSSEDAAASAAAKAAAGQKRASATSGTSGDKRSSVSVLTSTGGSDGGKKSKKKKDAHTAKKEKRKKEKEKTKIAEARALQKLNDEKAARNEAPITQASVIATLSNKHDTASAIDRQGATASIRVFKPVMNTAAPPASSSPADATITAAEQQRLDQLKLTELAQLDAEEAVRRRKKQQSRHNLLLNAQRMGGKVKAYDRDRDEAKWLEKKRRHRSANVQVAITEPLPIVKTMLEACMKNQQAIKQCLTSPTTLQTVNETDLRLLKASLDCYLSMFKSPLNFKCEVLWRLAVTCSDPQFTPMSITYIKLAHYAFNLLLERADMQVHHFQYNAIINSITQCEVEMDNA